MTKLGVVTQEEEKHISCGSVKSLSKGGGAQRPHNFWDPYLRPNGLTQSDESWCDIIGSSVFSGVRHALVARGGAQRPPHFWTSYLRAHSTRNDNFAC